MSLLPRFGITAELLIDLGGAHARVQIGPSVFESRGREPQHGLDVPVATYQDVRLIPTLIF